MLLSTESHFMWPLCPHYRSWTLRRFLIGRSELKNVYQLPASCGHFDCCMVTWSLSLRVGKHLVPRSGQEVYRMNSFPLSQRDQSYSSIFGWYFVSATQKSHTSMHKKHCQNWFQHHFFTLNTIKYYTNCFNLIYPVINMVCRLFSVCQWHSDNKAEDNSNQIGHYIRVIK